MKLDYDPVFEIFYDEFIEETDISQYINNSNLEDLESFMGKAARHFYEIGKNDKKVISIQHI